MYLLGLERLGLDLIPLPGCALPIRDCIVSVAFFIAAGLLLVEERLLLLLLLLLLLAHVDVVHDGRV